MFVNKRSLLIKAYFIIFVDKARRKKEISTKRFLLLTFLAKNDIKNGELNWVQQLQNKSWEESKQRRIRKKMPNLICISELGFPKYFEKVGLAGGICASFAHTILVPMDVLKTRLQVYPLFSILFIVKKI